jgi:ribosome-associated protein
MAKVLKDENLDALRLEYEQFTSPAKANDKQSKQLERLRSKLLEQGDAAINQLIEQHPNIERQKLRQLIRQANKELSQEKPGKSYKELFQYLKNEAAS